MSIDATKGGQNANSYLDITTADAIADGDFFLYDTWSQLDATTKERLLKTATKMIDMLPIKYEKANSEQALKFPVNNDDDGFSSVQIACLYQAVYIYKHKDMLDNVIAVQNAGIKSRTLGKVSETYSYKSIANNPKIMPDVYKILMKFLAFEVAIKRA